MVCRGGIGWTLVVLALFGARDAVAEKITFTGDVEQDFQASRLDSVRVFADGPTNDVAQSAWITDRGHISGWNIKDLRFNYDQATDVLQVGVNFFGIAGDSDGNGDPGMADPLTLTAGGIDLPNLGGRKSISVAFAPDSPTSRTQPGNAVIIAGVPADKSTAGPGLNGFTVAAYRNSNQGIAFNYGARLDDHVGELAFSPNAAQPDFEFTVRDFSRIPGLDPTQGVWVQAFAGSPDDVVAGEDSLGWIRIPQLAQQQVPEPAAVISWSILALGAAWKARRVRRRSVADAIRE